MRTVRWGKPAARITASVEIGKRGRYQDRDVGRVSTLVPGLEFRAIVDTKTAAGAIPAVNRAG